MGWQSTTFTIANAGTDSNKVNLIDNSDRRPLHMTVFAPAALTGTVTVKVSDVVGGTMVTLQSGGVDVTIAAGKAVAIGIIIAAEVQLVSSGAEAAERVFPVMGATAYGADR